MAGTHIGPEDIDGLLRSVETLQAELESVRAGWDGEVQTARAFLARAEQAEAERDAFRRVVLGGDCHQHLTHASLLTLAEDQRIAEDELNRDGGIRAERDALAARLARVEEALQDAWWAGRQSVQIVPTEKGTGPNLQQLCAAQLASLPNRPSPKGEPK